MSPRTPSQSAQPIHFYKMIALSFLFLTLILLGIIIFMSTKRAEIIITTKEDPIEATTTVTVGRGAVSAASIPGTIATTTVTLEKQFSPTGNREEPGLATGVVTLHNETNTAQILVVKTRLLTPDQILFRLTKQVTVPAKGTVEVGVAADKEGESGNIGSVVRFNIPGLNAELQKVIYASSDKPMTGGIRQIGVLSKEDVEKAQKELAAELEEKGKKELQDRFPGQTGAFKIAASNTTSNAEVGKEVSGFMVSGSATVLGVFYKNSDLMTLATKALEKHVIDDAELVDASDEAPTVTLDEYNAETDVATLTVYYSGLMTMNAESKQLQKMMFFGKNKDEIRRYVLSLDHVQSVDVEFHPVWVKTVPFVPEHVRVVLKKGE